MKVLLAKPRGFCAGVDRAVEIVEKALEVHGAPVYVKHEIVHNKHVVDDLRKKGAVFVEEIHEIPEGAVVVYSAHGVSPQVRTDAKGRKLLPIDATCPLVTKVHDEAIRFAREGYTILLIGHAGHPEVEGTMGHVPDRMILIESVADAEHVEVADTNRLMFLTQTTLSVDDTAGIVAKLQERFPKMRGPNKDDICYATQNRQNAVKDIVGGADVVLVIGAKYSSNANRLREVAERAGKPAYLIDSAADVKPEWIRDASVIGVSSGASTPEHLVKELIDRLKPDQIEEVKADDELIHFPLPEIAK